MTFIAFDLETTGFLAGVDRIVEIGAVRFNNGTIDAVFSTLVDPSMHIPEGASAVNGITDDMVKGKPDIESLLKPFADFCEDYIMVAHNAPFDTQFLKADIEKYESPAPTGLIIDTLQMARKVLPGLPNYKLGTLVQHLNIQAETFHRAEDDANYCGQLYTKMINKISTGTQEVATENLIALSGGKEIRLPQVTPQPKQFTLF